MQNFITMADFDHLAYKWLIIPFMEKRVILICLKDYD